jgi:ferric-dicitrate binding protein FerR (iron transport regulator)
MKGSDKHIDFNNNPDSHAEFFSNTKIGWDKSREEIWVEMEKKLGNAAAIEETAGLIRLQWVRYAVAALFLAFAAIAIVMQVYVKKVIVPEGQHAEVMLPGNSSVKLNAASVITYKPLKWVLERKVTLDGEAFFEVEPGRKFEVVSSMGTTAVMGTIFNIYARDTVYEVTCITGKVGVSGSVTENTVMILPGEKVSLYVSGNINIDRDINAFETVSWIEGRLSFTSAPLHEVFDEISRQFGVVIVVPQVLTATIPVHSERKWALRTPSILFADHLT